MKQGIKNNDFPYQESKYDRKEKYSSSYHRGNRGNQKRQGWIETNKRKKSKQVGYNEHDPKLLERQRLIEEGLKQQREKDVKLRSESSNNNVSNKSSSSLRIEEDRKNRTAEQLFKLQRQTLCYSFEYSSASLTRQNLLDELRRSETSLHRRSSGAWPSHHRDYLNMFPLLHQRIKAATTFPTPSLIAQISSHHLHGHVIGLNGRLEHVSNKGELIAGINTTDSYNLLSWNQHSEQVAIFVAVADYHITFFVVHERPYDNIEMINEMTFERTVENFHWLNDHEAITIIQDEIHKFSFNYSGVMVDIRVQKKVFKFWKFTITTMINFDSSQGIMLLLGCRNGSIILYDVQRNAGEVIHCMPYRVCQLYQLKGNKDHYIAKDVAGNIHVYSMNERNTTFLKVREGSSVRMDRCGFIVFGNEEFVITSTPTPSQHKQLAQMTFTTFNASSPATPHPQPEVAPISIYSLRHSTCCVYQVPLSQILLTTLNCTNAQCEIVVPFKEVDDNFPPILVKAGDQVTFVQYA